MINPTLDPKRRLRIDSGQAGGGIGLVPLTSTSPPFLFSRCITSASTASLFQVRALEIGAHSRIRHMPRHLLTLGGAKSAFQGSKHSRDNALSSQNGGGRVPRQGHLAEIGLRGWRLLHRDIPSLPHNPILLKVAPRSVRYPTGTSAFLGNVAKS
jgi:hypothetical protein